MEDDNKSIQSTTIEDGEDVVKAKCCEQRDAELGEPKCVICGRYGEYICDETDDDICSLECKQTLLSSITKSKNSPKRLPVFDECYYVRDDNSGVKSNSQSLSVHQTDFLRKKLEIDVRSVKSNSQLLSVHQADLFRKKLEIDVRGDIVPAPILSFSSCNLHHKLLLNLETSGHEIPTPVQMQAIPSALIGQNLLVSAETGSGKTASFLVPIISRCASFSLQHGQTDKKPLTIVLTPTRELCMQVEEQAKVLGKGLPFKTALVVGGDAMASQLHRIHQGVEMIVATPGRLIDLLTKHEIELDGVNILVLDEVDCMLEKGFSDQVMQIFCALSQPQIMMYSATISLEVEKMATSMAKNLVVVSIGRRNTPNVAVKQLAIWVESKQKKQKLFNILTSKQHFMPPVVIFVASRFGADLLSEAITVTTKMKALSIHGEKSMKDRREIMNSFLVGEVSILVATGILGRGVNLLGVRQVIIFDLPNSMKEYVHMIGRASRMGEEGTAYVFVNDENKNVFPELIEKLKSSGAAIPRELANSRYANGSLHTSRSQKKRKYGL